MKTDWLACSPMYQDGQSQVRVVLRLYLDQLVVHKWIKMGIEGYTSGSYYQKGDFSYALRCFHRRSLELYHDGYPLVLETL